jgi:hypothetical protein
MRWRWRRLLILPLLASVHACDCGGCGDSDGTTSINRGGSSGCDWHPDFSCSLDLNACGIGGLCLVSEGGTCPGNLLLDPTASCGDGGGFCCVLPAPACSALGGVCQAACPQGTIDGDCGDAGVCCMPAPSGDDSSSGMEVPDGASSTDAEDAEVTGSCNGAPCASGCACVPLVPDAALLATDGATLPPDGATLSPDAGGGLCVCLPVDASTDAEGLENAADAGTSGEGGDAQMSDAANAVDAMTSADGSVEAGAGGPCGVLLCAGGCTCTSPTASECVCP